MTRLEEYRYICMELLCFAFGILEDDRKRSGTSIEESCAIIGDITVKYLEGRLDERYKDFPLKEWNYEENNPVSAELN